MKNLTMTPELRATVLNAMSFSHRTQAGYAAKPYVDAILSIPQGGATYGEDDLHGLLTYLRSNLRPWRGPLAREVKAELDEVLA